MFAIVRFAKDKSTKSVVIGLIPQEQTSEIFGPYVTEQEAEDTLSAIGARPGWFSSVICEGDHTADYEGWLRGEAEYFAILPLRVRAPNDLR